VTLSKSDKTYEVSSGQFTNPKQSSKKRGTGSFFWGDHQAMLDQVSVYKTTQLVMAMGQAKKPADFSVHIKNKSKEHFLGRRAPSL